MNNMPPLCFRHADMQLLEHVTMATTAGGGQEQQQQPEGQPGQEGLTHVLTGSWDPSETAFAELNRETPADVQSVFVTIAADLVISQVSALSYSSVLLRTMYLQSRVSATSHVFSPGCRACSFRGGDQVPDSPAGREVLVLLYEEEPLQAISGGQKNYLLVTVPK